MQVKMSGIKDISIVETQEELEKRLADFSALLDQEIVSRNVEIQGKILRVLVGLKSGEFTSIKTAADVVGSNTRTIQGWLTRYEEIGLDELLTEKEQFNTRQIEIPVTSRRLQNAIDKSENPSVIKSLEALLALKSGEYPNRRQLSSDRHIHFSSLNLWLEQLNDCIEQFGNRRGFVKFLEMREHNRPRVPIGGKSLEQGKSARYQFRLPTRFDKLLDQRVESDERSARADLIRELLSSELDALESDESAALINVDELHQEAVETSVGNNILVRLPYGLAVRVEAVRERAESDLELIRRLLCSALLR